MSNRSLVQEHLVNPVTSDYGLARRLRRAWVESSRNVGSPLLFIRNEGKCSWDGNDFASNLRNDEARFQISQDDFILTHVVMQKSVG